MKILIIAQGESPHTYRTLVNAIKFCPNIDFELFCSSPFGIMKEIRSAVKCYFKQVDGFHQGVEASYWNQIYVNDTTKFSQSHEYLAEVLSETQYDIVHMLGMQESAYLYSKALKYLGDSYVRPYSILSLWGNCLYYFSRVKNHTQSVIESLKHIDRIQSESNRDIPIALELGFKGSFTEVIQPTFYFEEREKTLSEITPHKQVPIAQRKIIAVRGSYEIRGRGFLIIEALKRIKKELLKDYEVVLFGAKPIDVASLTLDCEIKHKIFPWLDWSSLQTLFKLSKFVISMNTTDGTPQMFYESSMNGVFPIFSKDTGLASLAKKSNGNETILLADPNDLNSIKLAIEKSMCYSNEEIEEMVSINNQTIFDQQNLTRFKRFYSNLYKV